MNTEKIYEKLNLNIVLVEPEIPSNTGNIGRTCVATNSKLHLVGPMSFEITDKRVKRAGLDYWPNLEWQYYKNFNEWFQSVENKSRVFYFSTKVTKSYVDIDYKHGDWLVFGKETKGLDKNIIDENPNQTVTIPMPGKVRSLNLSNSVAIALFEGMRQL